MRSLERITTFTHALAAAALAVLAWLVAWSPGAIGVPESDAYLRSFPLPSRFDTWIGLPAAMIAALAVTVFWRGRVAVWLRRCLGLAGLCLVAFMAWAYFRALRHDCYRLGGCDAGLLWFLWVDVGVAIVASTLLLVLSSREPAPRLRWVGLGVVVVLALVSATWTYTATRSLERYTGKSLANVHLEGYFAANNDFVPGEVTKRPAGTVRPAVPALPMAIGSRPDKMICGADWRVVPFTDRSRCLPFSPLVRLEPDDLVEVSVARPTVGADPAIFMTLRDRAARGFREALRRARSFRFVLMHREGTLVTDVRVDGDVPGPTFMLTVGKEKGALGRTLDALLGRRHRLSHRFPVLGPRPPSPNRR